MPVPDLDLKNKNEDKSDDSLSERIMKELEKSQYDSYGDNTQGKESSKHGESAKEEDEDKSVENVYSSKSFLF